MSLRPDRAAWQADALAVPAVPYTDQLACARRELRLRLDVYGRQVESKRMTRVWADHQIRCQQAIIHTLEQLVAVYAPPAEETLPL